MAVIAGRGLTGGTTPLSGGSGSRDCVDTKYPVTMNATLESFNVNVENGNPTLKFKVWRPNGANYDFIGESQTFNSFTVGDNTGLTLNTPINVLVGDLIGLHLTGLGGGLNAIPDDAGTTVFDTDADNTSNTPQSEFDSNIAFALAFEAVGTPATSDTTTVTDLKEATQRNIATNNQVMPFSGTYTGTPTALERQVRYGDGAQEVVSDWATFDASPSGNTFSGSVTLNGSVRPYVIEVRHTNTPAATDTSNNFYIGDYFGVTGESLALDMLTEGSSETPVAGVFNSDSTTASLSTPTTGDGQVAFGNAIVAHTSAAVFIQNTGVGGMALISANRPSNFLYNPTTPTANYNNNLAAYNAAGDWAANLFIIGINDAVFTNATPAFYKQSYLDYFAQWRTDTRAGLPVIASLTGVFTNSVDDDDLYGEYVQEQKAAYDETANVYWTAHYDQPRQDHTHLSAAGYAELGRRMANAVITELLSGSEPYQPPRVNIVSSVSNTQTLFTLTRPEGTDITPSLNITDVKLSADGFTTEVPVSSVSRTGATSFTVTHNSATVTDYRYNFGSNPIVTGLVQDNSARTLPLTQDEGSVTVSSTLNLTITGAGNDTLSIEFYDRDTKQLLETRNVTFTNGSASEVFSVASGTVIGGFYDGATPPTTGTGVYGVTV